jgi:hypothetical protein
MILVQVQCLGEDDSECFRRTLRTRMEESLSFFYRNIHHKNFLRLESYNEYLEKCKKYSSDLKGNLTEYIEHFGSCDIFPIQHTIRLAKKAQIIMDVFCNFDDEFRKSEYPQKFQENPP